jgi:hypothetical protein
VAAVSEDSDFVSIEGPVETVDGALVLRIPFQAGGDKLAASAGGIGRIEGDILRVGIPAWLAVEIGLEAGMRVIVGNQDGCFNIQLSDDSEDEPS